MVIYLLLVIVTSIALVAVSDKDVQKEIIKSQDIETSEEEIFVATKVVLGIVLVIWILGVLVNALLIFGAVHEKAKLIYIWFVVHIILLVIGTVMIIVNLITGANNSGSKGGSIGPTIINILLTIYFLIVVYSFYKELKEKGQTRPGQPTAFHIEGYPMPPANAPPAY